MNQIISVIVFVFLALSPSIIYGQEKNSKKKLNKTVKKLQRLEIIAEIPVEDGVWKELISKEGSFKILFPYIDLFDDEHSEGERRFLMVGESEQNRLLIVSYTERENSVRIISARELTPKEKREYEHGRFG